MVEKEKKYTLPSDAKINSISPGALAMERFKLALALDNSEFVDEKEKEEAVKNLTESP